MQKFLITLSVEDVIPRCSESSIKRKKLESPFFDWYVTFKEQ